MVIDPPSGWKYGFPKTMPDNIVTKDEISKWLLEQGYPEKDLELALKYSRYWSQPDEE